MKDLLDATFFPSARPSLGCPPIEHLLLYSKGLYSSLDEDDFNRVEDCLFERECPSCLAVFRKESDGPTALA